jgi:hypothetical protein
MRVGRPPISLGQHGAIAMERIDGGRFRASARLRTWDDEVHRVTATGGNAAGTRALLKERMAQRLRTSELFVWRSLTSDDPFHELVICWLDDLWSFSDASQATCALCERIVRTQLKPAFGHLTIGDLTRDRIEQHLRLLRAKSEVAAASADAVLHLLLDFSVGEGAIDSNPMAALPHGQVYRHLGDLDDHRTVVRGRIDLRREERRDEARVAGD